MKTKVFLLLQTLKAQDKSSHLFKYRISQMNDLALAGDEDTWTILQNKCLFVEIIPTALEVTNSLLSAATTSSWLLVREGEKKRMVYMEKRLHQLLKELHSFFVLSNASNVRISIINDISGIQFLNPYLKTNFS